MDHAGAAPAELHGAAARTSRERLLIMWSWRPAADADLRVNLSGPPAHTWTRRNDSTGHEAMTLLQRKVTAQVTGESQLLTVACAADNLERVRDRGREGQVFRRLE